MDRVDNFSQFKKMLARRVGKPLVIVERYGWRELGHTGDIYVPGVLQKVSAKEIVVERNGEPSYLTLPPIEELRFPDGVRMEHWGKGRNGPAVLLAYEWPDVIDQDRAAKAAAAFEITSANHGERVKQDREAAERRRDERAAQATRERQAGERIAQAWMDHQMPEMVRLAAGSPQNQDTLFLIHEGVKDMDTHDVIIVCRPDKKFFLVDASRGNMERDGRKVWQLTEWPLTAQSLHFRGQSVPGLDEKLTQPGSFEPKVFDLPRVAEQLPELYGNLPGTIAARPSVEREAHRLIDLRVHRGPVKAGGRTVEVTHQSAYMAGPVTATFRPSPALRGKKIDHMLAVVEAASREGALEFRGGKLFVSKDINVQNMSVSAGMVPMVAEQAGAQER